jgi:hypothetical protein
MPSYEEVFHGLDPPYPAFDASILGDGFPDELATASRLWTSTGYAQGIAAYLNFFLLTDFIVTHDAAHPPRFASFRSMADSFYQTDLFIRDVTDSGKEPTGGISNPRVRRQLGAVMARHARLAIPPWMMTYFGYQLLECVEDETRASADDRQRHLSYMAKALRIMGIPFSDERATMVSFARDVERRHAGPSPRLEEHAANILTLGEMVGVSSRRDRILGSLPEATRAVFAPIHGRVRPSLPKRAACRILGKFLVPKAIGAPRHAVPWADAGPG